MIRELRGQVRSVGQGGAVVDVGGWGVYVHLPSAALVQVDAQVFLRTYLSFKQDGVDLYGFLSEEDRSFFEMLLSVPNVGPKTALTTMRKAPLQALQSAIASRDLEYLTRVAGLGKKAAEKLMVELSEKLTHIASGHDEGDAEVFDTLVALGYTEREARAAVGAISSKVVGKEARLKAALSAAAT